MGFDIKDIGDIGGVFEEIRDTSHGFIEPVFVAATFAAEQLGSRQLGRRGGIRFDEEASGSAKAAA